MSFISTAGDLGIQSRVPTSAYYGQARNNNKHSCCGITGPTGPAGASAPLSDPRSATSSGPTGPTGATGSVFLSSANLNLDKAPIEGESLATTIGVDLAYMSGNTIVFFNTVGSFEGIVSSYDHRKGAVGVARITNILGTVTGPQTFTVNLGGARGATIFSGSAPPGVSGRIGDFYLDTQSFVLYKLILP